MFREREDATGEEGEIDWSEINSLGRSATSNNLSGPAGEGALGRSYADMSTLSLNVGTMSVASWDAASEPTLGTDAGTDAGTDQDIGAVSGIPDGDSDDDDDGEDGDIFEMADSSDLGAVALCVSGSPASHHSCIW